MALPAFYLGYTNKRLALSGLACRCITVCIRKPCAAELLVNNKIGMQAPLVLSLVGILKILYAIIQKVDSHMEIGAHHCCSLINLSEEKQHRCNYTPYHDPKLLVCGHNFRLRERESCYS
jgi:hypothetical protein